MIQHINQQTLYRATITPVAEGTPRPLWSVMIPTYNCANYLRETLTSVLAQDPGADVMQIEVVDDCSTKDDPQAIVEELGRGRVSFYRQPENVGYIRNFETCLQRSRGKLIHLLHGDDCVRDDFYRKIQQIFEHNPEVGATFCRHIFMDEQGHWECISSLEESKSGILKNSLERIVTNHLIQTPSIVVRRDVYEALGGFDCRFTCVCEDWEMWVRIAANYPIAYEVEPLALYRVARSGSLSKSSIRSGKYAREVLQAHEIIQSYLYKYLSPNVANKCLSYSKKQSVLSFINIAQHMIDNGDMEGAIVQLKEVLSSGISLTVYWRVGRVVLKATKYQLKNVFNRFTQFIHYTNRLNV